MKWNSFTKLQLPPEPLTRGLRPQIPVISVLCPQLNLLKPPPPNKIPGYATAGTFLPNSVWRWCHVTSPYRLLRRGHSSTSQLWTGMANSDSSISSIPHYIVQHELVGLGGGDTVSDSRADYTCPWTVCPSTFLQLSVRPAKRIITPAIWFHWI